MANATKEKQSACVAEQSSRIPCGTDISVEETPAYRRLVRLILKHVSDKTGFFLEERLTTILKPYCDSEKNLVRLDNVFAVSI